MLKNRSQFLVDGFRGIGSLFFPDLCPYCEGDPDCIAIDGRSCEVRWSDPPSIRFINGAPIYSVVPYDDRAMSVVLAAKERGERRAKSLITRSIESVIERMTLRASPLIVVPTPSSKRAIRARGEDFLLTVARSLSFEERMIDDRRVEIVIAPILNWNREMKDQSGLTAMQRSENLFRACEVDEIRTMRLLSRIQIPPGEPLQIAIIDDVVTSGATMAAALSAISHSSLGLRSSLLGITACHSARPL